MNHTKAGRCCPHHASIRLRECASNLTKPLHDVARLNRHFGNTFLQHFGQISGAFLRVLAVLRGLCLDEFPVDRPPRYTIWGRHRRMLDDRTIDLSKQFSGCILVVL